MSARTADDAGVGRERRVRVAAYVVCVDDADRLLLARWIGVDGPHWTLPGGGLDPGEHPQHGALRELTEETGYVGELEALLGVDAHRFVGVQGIDWHAVRFVYRARVVGGALAYERDGSTDRAGWFTGQEIAGLTVVPLVGVGHSWARLPGRPVGDLNPSAAASDPDCAEQLLAKLGVVVVVRSAAGAVLLIRPAKSDASRRWRLPSGDVEHGEPFDAAVNRAAVREIGSPVIASTLRTVISEITNDGHDGAAVWRVRLVYDVDLRTDDVPRRHAGVEVQWISTDALADVAIDPEVRRVLAT